MLRHRDANIDLEQIAVPALHRRCDDRHATAGDPVMEFFQPLGLFFNFSTDHITLLDISYRDALACLEQSGRGLPKLLASYSFKEQN